MGFRLHLTGNSRRIITWTTPSCQSLAPRNSQRRPRPPALMIASSPTTERSAAQQFAPPSAFHRSRRTRNVSITGPAASLPGQRFRRLIEPDGVWVAMAERVARRPSCPCLPAPRLSLKKTTRRRPVFFLWAFDLMRLYRSLGEHLVQCFPDLSGVLGC